MFMRVLSAGLLLALVSSPLAANLYQSENWALVGDVEGSAGYDSNLTLSNDGPASSFVSLEPELVFKRHGSSTRLEFRAAADYIYYLDEADSQVDGLAAVRYAYPIAEDTLPRLEASAQWRHFTAGNVSVGRRITSELLNTAVGARLFDSGKLGLDGRVTYDRQDYSADNLNANDRAALQVGLAYEPNPNREFAFNVFAAAGASHPHAPGGLRVKNREWGATVSARGKLSAKLTGEIYAGADAVRYREAFRRSSVLPVAGGSVTWQATAASRVNLALDLGADYSPEGDALAARRATLSLDQTIVGPWRWQGRITPSEVDYYHPDRYRRDRGLGAGITVYYEPSERFRGALAYDYTDFDSDRAFAVFRRHLTAATLTYRY